MKKPAVELCTPLPTPEQELELHGRLLDGNHTATTDLAVAFLDHLIQWLATHNRGIPEEFCAGAASDALCALMKNPRSYKPGRDDSVSLRVYLQMSAQRDLQNLLRQEERHHRFRDPWESVEQSPLAGKYLGRDDDPSLPLEINEAMETATAEVLPSVRNGLTDVELRVLALILQGERKTAVYVEACGLGHLPAQQQRAEVNRLKNKVKQRLKRARLSHGQ